jgi:hypothetical protein
MELFIHIGTATNQQICDTYINLIQNEGFMLVLQVIAFMRYTELPNQLVRMLVVVQLVQKFSALMKYEG